MAWPEVAAAPPRPDGPRRPCQGSGPGSLELWSDFDLRDVRPADALAGLSPEIRVLLVGGTLDRRTPPEVVRAVFARLPQLPDRKALWLREGSGHGRVWRDDPDGYRVRLSALLSDL